MASNKSFIICILILTMLSTLDLITTLYGVEVLKLTELNSLANYLFSYFGLPGYIICLLLYSFYFVIVLYGISLISNIIYKLNTKKNLSEENTIFILSFITGVQAFFSIWAITNNLLNILTISII